MTESEQQFFALIDQALQELHDGLDRTEALIDSMILSVFKERAKHSLRCGIHLYHGLLNPTAKCDCGRQKE